MKMQEKKLKVVDLFSGCGGFSYGFKQAGYDIISGVDQEKSAVDTASYNLHWKDGVNRDHHCGDITKMDFQPLKKELEDEDVVVIGGPPCQAYSQIGRAKLRSLGEERVHTNDKRGFLFQDYLSIALELNAKVVVMENVMESVNYDGMNVPQVVCEILEDNNYSAKWTVLNSANYGVPQLRERVFVIGYRDEEVTASSFPLPTHKPINGKETPGIRRAKKFATNKHFIPAPLPGDDLPEWVTVEESISDLPHLFKTSKSKYQLYPLHLKFPYVSEAQNVFQTKMRTWSGIDAGMVNGHSFRKTQRDFKIFERMKEGDNYYNASLVAEEMFNKQCEMLGIRSSDSEEYKKLRKKIVPPYSTEKFLNKWQKLIRTLPSHTLVAHLSTDTYSHIHPWEPRGISVREAARIQSFPDHFHFPGTMGEAFRQIGNAVPPLLSNAIAEQIYQDLERTKQESVSV
ncbi:modification methylase [Pontibacillus chungwhensis BH030062]|uniref:DNA (cytosine-5-)-methyltransferase n=1 Tax=Pontibacillus chungwhensis BH030062 TaxID=1385513 RepID=A0A0A2UWX7_9BACI|nr:modification methylase [Pontibacillus chungwhensis BH030062]